MRGLDKLVGCFYLMDDTLRVLPRTPFDSCDGFNFLVCITCVVVGMKLLCFG